jgi:hypothetical protein
VIILINQVKRLINSPHDERSVQGWSSQKSFNFNLLTLEPFRVSLNNGGMKILFGLMSAVGLGWASGPAWAVPAPDYRLGVVLVVGGWWLVADGWWLVVDLLIVALGRLKRKLVEPKVPACAASEEQDI